MKRKTITLFATLLFFGVVAAQNQNDNQNFPDSQFLILDQIKPLTQDERLEFDSIFNAEYAISGFRDIAFNMAMSKTLTNPNYYKTYYKDQIAKRASILYDDDLVYYREKMELNESSLDSIKPYLKKCSNEIALCELYFFAFPSIRREAIEQIRETYKNSMSGIYIKNESKGASHNLGLVLQNRERLKLSEAQVDSIVEAAQIIKELSDDSVITKKKNNRWLYERKFIIQILNEEQTGEFVVIRNSEYAFNYAQKIWNEGKSYQMDFEYDSLKVIQEIFSYQVNKSKIQYIYRDDKKKMWEMEDFLYKESYPKFLRQLTVERRKRQAEETEDKNQLKF